jgi:hypothetical protein
MGVGEALEELNKYDDWKTISCKVQK